MDGDSTLGILSHPLTWLLPGILVGLLAYFLSRKTVSIDCPLVLPLGLVTLVLYTLPFPISNDSLGDVRSIALFFTSLLLLPALSWFSAALLLASNIRPEKTTGLKSGENPGFKDAPTKLAPWYPTASLALSAALIFVSLQHLYWIFAWDATTDAIGMILQIPVLWIAAGVALMLVLLGRRKHWVELAVSAMFLAAVIAVIQMAMRNDFGQVTEIRAAQVSQALERRFLAVGSYPNSLEELEPWYLWSVPVPMIIYGLDWCYEGGEDYFHLGFVTREHWSSPELIIRSYGSAGALPDHELDCSAQIAALEARAPGFFFVDENQLH